MPESFLSVFDRSADYIGEMAIKQCVSNHQKQYNWLNTTRPCSSLMGCSCPCAAIERKLTNQLLILSHPFIQDTLRSCKALNLALFHFVTHAMICLAFVITVCTCSFFDTVIFHEWTFVLKVGSYLALSNIGMEWGWGLLILTFIKISVWFRRNVSLGVPLH